MSGATTHWWRQRLSSLLLLPLTAWLLWAGVSLSGADYATAQAFMGHPVNAALAALLVAAALYHAQAGIQVVVEDYVPGSSFPAILIWLVRIATAAGLLATLFALYIIATGA